MSINNKFRVEITPYGGLRAVLEAQMEDDGFQSFMIQFIALAKRNSCAELSQDGKTIFRKQDFQNGENYVNYKWLARRAKEEGGLIFSPMPYAFYYPDTPDVKARRSVTAAYNEIENQG